MNKSLSEYQQYLSRVKPWIAVAVVVGVVVFGYAISVVRGYSSGTDEVASLTAKIDGLSAKAPQSPPDEAVLMAEQAVEQQMLGSALSLYSYEHQYKIVDMMSEAADEVGVSLTVVAVGNSSAMSQGGVPLFSQSMNTSVTGDTLDIYRFLAVLQDRVPSTDVTSLTLGSLGANTSAQVHFLFFLSPESVQGR